MEKLENLCKEIGQEYGITMFQNIPDNVFEIIQAAEPTQEEKALVWDLYHEYLYVNFSE